MGHPGLGAKNLARFLYVGLGNNHSLSWHMLKLFRACKWTQKWREREKKDSLMYFEADKLWGEFCVKASFEFYQWNWIALPVSPDCCFTLYTHCMLHVLSKNHIWRFFLISILFKRKRSLGTLQWIWFSNSLSRAWGGVGSSPCACAWSWEMKVDRATWTLPWFLCWSTVLGGRHQKTKNPYASSTKMYHTGMCMPCVVIVL